MRGFTISEHAIKRLRQRVHGYKHASHRKASAAIRSLLANTNLVRIVVRGPATILIGDKLCGIRVGDIIVTVFKPDVEELSKRGIILDDEIPSLKEGEEDEPRSNEATNCVQHEGSHVG